MGDECPEKCERPDWEETVLGLVNELKKLKREIERVDHSKSMLMHVVEEGSKYHITFTEGGNAHIADAPCYSFCYPKTGMPTPHILGFLATDRPGSTTSYGPAVSCLGCGNVKPLGPMEEVVNGE